MKKHLLKHLKKLQTQEVKFLDKQQGRFFKEKVAPVISSVEDKIPSKVRETLDAAFYKGFVVVFEKGTQYIEKMFDKENIKLEHDVRNYAIDRSTTKKTLRSMDSISRKSKWINQSLSSLEGVGLGLLGIGIPDIPVFIGMILKTLYEIALSYGFDYANEEEQIYMLLLIACAVAPEQQRAQYGSLADQLAIGIDRGNVDENSSQVLVSDRESAMKEAAKMLSDAMLTAKFVQGLPIVGVVGGLANYTIISKVSRLARIKYKQRYLSKKL